MNKQEYIKELKQEIAYEKRMIAKGDHIEERKRDIKDMADELDAVVSGKREFENHPKDSKNNKLSAKNSSLRIGRRNINDKEIHRHLCNCAGWYTHFGKIGGVEDE